MYVITVNYLTCISKTLSEITPPSITPSEITQPSTAPSKITHPSTTHPIPTSISEPCKTYSKLLQILTLS